MRWLLAKDFRILRRSPVLIALLVVYPILIATLIGLALSREPEQPKVAFVNSTTTRFVVGNSEIDGGQLAPKILKSVDLRKVKTRSEAVRLVKEGEVVAAIIVPDDITQQLSLGRERPTIELIYSVHDPVKARYVQNVFKSGINDINKSLSRGYADVTRRYLELLIRGGKIEIFDQSFDIFGLERSKIAVDRAREKLRKNTEEYKVLKEVSDFARIAMGNLDLSNSVLTSVSEPIQVKQISLSGSKTTLDAFAVAVAVTIALMFIGVLLGAGMLALEREENTYRRLVSGPISVGGLISVKLLFAASCALLAGLLLILGVGVFLPVSWSGVLRWGLGLLFGSLGFATFGVALGALTREVRSASLLAVLVTLPLAFLALVPSGSVAGPLYMVMSTISWLFPFDSTQDLIASGISGDRVISPLTSSLELLALVVIYSAVARLALSRPTWR